MNNMITIGDISDIVTKGTTPTTIGGNYTSEGVNFIKVESITDDYTIDLNRISYISEEINERLSRSKLQVNDILLTIAGTIGKSTVVTEKIIPANTNQAVAIIRPKSNINPYLIHYFLQSSFNQGKMKQLSGLSVQPNINLEQVKSLQLRDMKYKEQNELVSKIKPYDDKILNNIELIELLEEYSQLIFYKWFIDFNFPDKEGKPYRDNGGKMHEVDGKMIPDGWDRIELNSIVKIKTETLNPQENPDKLFNHYSIPVFDEKKLPQMELGKSILSNKYMVDSNNILVSKLNPWFKRVAYPYNVEEAVCSTEFVVWEPAINNILESLYIIANTDSFTLHCTKAANGTSNSHKRVNPNYMLKYKINYNESILYEFNKIAKPIVMRINQAIFENQQLAEIRDLLIKKLIV